MEVDDIRHVFRTVSPLIIRQWKDVCRELGVSDDNLYEIERGKPWERLSEMAYQGLCAWLDKEGKHATKGRLINALRQCELKRAEEAIEGIIIRKTERRSSNPGRKGSSSKTRKSKPFFSDQTDCGQITDPSDLPRSACRRNGKTSKANGEKSDSVQEASSNDQTDCVQTTKSSTRSACRRYSKTSIAKREKWNIASDEIAVEVTASEIMTDKPPGDSWMDTYQKMVLHFYTNVVKNEDDHKRALGTLMDFRDVFVKRIMFGSVVTVVQCKTLSGLGKLQQSYSSGQLEKIFQRALVTKDTLEELGATEVFIEVHIDPSYFEKCRRTLEERKLSRKALRRSKSSGLIKGDNSYPEGTINWQELLNALEETIASARVRYQRLQRDQFVLLAAIRKTPIGGRKMCSFGEVQSCLLELKSQVDDEEALKNLLVEFVEIVLLIKHTTGRLSETLKDYRTVSRSCEGPMSDLELMLNPDFPFKEDPKLIPEDLTVSDKRLFIGFLSYIPLLLLSFQKIYSCIKATVIKEKEILYP